MKPSSDTAVRPGRTLVPVPAAGRHAAGPAPAGHAGHAASDLITVRVWRLPVRVLHWLLVLSIVVLALTGFYIGTPSLLPASGQLMATVRTVHIAFGWLQIAVVFARFGWMFLDDHYGRWNQFVPTTRKRRRLLIDTVLYYSFRRATPPAVAGHNPLASLAYLGVFGLLLVQGLTGAALQSLDHVGGTLWTLTGSWVFNLAAIPVVRLVHHLIMWVLIAFVLQHVYSAVLVDTEEHSGEVSSIISGRKTVHRNAL